MEHGDKHCHAYRTVRLLRQSGVLILHAHLTVFDSACQKQTSAVILGLRQHAVVVQQRSLHTGRSDDTTYMQMNVGPCWTQAVSGVHHYV